MVEIYLGVVTHWAFWVVLIGCGAFYGIQKQFEVPKLKALHQRPFDALRDYYVFLVFAIGGLVLVGTYWMYLHDIMWSVHVMVGRLRALADAPTGDDFAETLNNLAQGSALLLGALAAAATLIFTLLRTWINERTTRATEEGLITDRINAAVASLGADKTLKGFDDGKDYTRPNIEVRVGAILALERIAKRSPDVHIQIMEILCAYIRENTKENRERPREDIQTALNVIGRRNQIQRTLEGPKTIFLSGSILNGSNMEGMDFSGAIMIGVKLNGANLNRANFKFTNLFMANLADASLMNTSFFNADLRRATFDRAVSFKTDFRKANLVGANLYLTLTLKHFPNLLRLDFSVINGEKLDCRYLTQTQINSIFSDKIAIDVSLNRPVHWPTIILADEFLEMEWKRWLQDPDGYVFDPTQYGEKYTTQTGE